MLYQLSYSPRQFKIYRKIQARPLTVLRRIESQLNGERPGHERDRKKVAPVERSQ